MEVPQGWALKDLAKFGHDILTYQIFSIDNQGFSLSTMLTGIVLFSLGYLFSQRLSKSVERRVLTRLQMEDSLRHTMSRAIFYLLVIFWSLFTLRLLSVPLTIFTVVGGALAVGLGFGSQNLVNNFISGLMVMLERPMKIGDHIEINGMSGFVEKIGIRATHIKTLKNTHVIIPNKTFLEEALTNNSLSEGLAKSFIRIGVAYGSDVKKVVQLLMESAKEDPKFRSHPESAVLFIDFADSCLLFELISWASAADVGEKVDYESRVRFRINEKFAANKISIPFPQRDIRVEMVQPGKML